MPKKMKLVRDKIPEIIKNKGQEPKTRILDNQENREELIKKLKEEVEEFAEDRNKEELADIMEVIQALISNFNFTTEEIESIRQEKRQERGGFEKRIFLEEVR